MYCLFLSHLIKSLLWNIAFAVIHYLSSQYNLVKNGEKPSLFLVNNLSVYCLYFLEFFLNVFSSLLCEWNAKPPNTICLALEREEKSHKSKINV